MDYYDSIAPGYDELHGEEQLDKLNLIKTLISTDESLASFRNASSVIDIGCGSGISTRFFEVSDREGIDPSKELIRIAIKNDPYGRYLVMSAEKLRPSRKYDLAISLTAIQNFHDIRKGLSNIKDCADIFILTYLKNSTKSPLIEKEISSTFDIIRRIEHPKDMIFFCKR